VTAAAGWGADAIMGVTFFSDAKPEHFGVFDRSLISMFRITSGESWADYMPPLDDDGTVNFGTCIFFVSYTVIVCWTLLQASPRALGPCLALSRRFGKGAAAPPAAEAGHATGGAKELAGWEAAGVAVAPGVGKGKGDGLMEARCGVGCRAGEPGDAHR
jgi:hypothetical protein